MNTTNHQGKTILIVDDNPTNLKVLFDYLKDAGFKALVATSGNRALEQVKRLIPDLILLDVMMPGLDGFETCRRLKAAEATKEIPVIFMTALSDPEDKIRGFEVGAVDYITKPFQQQEVLARLNMHLTLQHQKTELQELNATKDKFFSIIAHDLRGAFSSLLGFSELLMDTIEDDDRGRLKIIAENLSNVSKNTYTLLENLLEWARLQRDAISYNPIEVKLSGLVQETAKLVKTSAELKQITIKNEVDPEIVIYGDVFMVMTILRNLVSNAIKFTPKGGWVAVTSCQVDHGVQVLVSDNGVGINPKNISRLFKVHEKFHTSGTNDEGGTGLGLVLCKELVEKHGGQIWIESQQDQGTTISFILPHSNTNAP